MAKTEFPPFYVGQKVVGSSFASEHRSKIKKGHPYTITHCHLSINPANGTGPYWYVGYDGVESHAWLTPKLFDPIIENFQSISLEKILEEETKLISVN